MLLCLISLKISLSVASPYASAKAALLAYTKSLSTRLAKQKVRVNMISPGNIHFPGGNWDQKKNTNPT